MRFPSARILVFAKAPVPGRAKTRLIPVLGAEGAARLHERLLRQTVDTLATAGLAPLTVRCAPDCTHPVFAELAERWRVGLERQCDGDLGARLEQGVRAAFSRPAEAVDRVILVGCDCPALDAGYLAAALAALDDHDAVLGPAADGGYVLLGLRGAAPALFRDIPWGGPAVAGLTRERMRRLGWRWRELATLRDLDRPEDLSLLPGWGSRE